MKKNYHKKKNPLYNNEDGSQPSFNPYYKIPINSISLKGLNISIYTVILAYTNPKTNKVNLSIAKISKILNYSEHMVGKGIKKLIYENLLSYEYEHGIRYLKKIPKDENIRVSTNIVNYILNSVNLGADHLSVVIGILDEERSGTMKTQIEWEKFMKVGFIKFKNTISDLLAEKIITKIPSKTRTRYMLEDKFVV